MVVHWARYYCILLQALNIIALPHVPSDGCRDVAVMIGTKISETIGYAGIHYDNVVAFPSAHPT